MITKDKLLKKVIEEINSAQRVFITAYENEYNKGEINIEIGKNGRCLDIYYKVDKEFFNEVQNFLKNKTSPCLSAESSSRDSAGTEGRE